MEENNIVNISPLKNLSNLRYVDLIGCPIEDYLPVEFVDMLNK